MGDGWVYWYRRSMNATEIADQLRRFNELGFVLENGHSGRITMLDEVGEQVPTTREGLIAELCSGVDVSYQIWYPGTSVGPYCRLQRLTESTILQSFGLNGLKTDERRQVQAVVWDAFARSIAESQALVVDIFNRTEEVVDWNAAVAEGVIPTEGRPDLVAMRVRAPTRASSRWLLDEFQLVSYREID
jgi:hypothetical protein